jgi:muconolactone D-isomerase
MSEFLVQMTLNLDPEMDPVTLADLREREADAARALAEEGVIVRLWRIPGARANWGLWHAADADALHEAIRSLPLWRWTDVVVHPLARHENDPTPRA